MNRLMSFIPIIIVGLLVLVVVKAPNVFKRLGTLLGSNDEQKLLDETLEVILDQVEDVKLSKSKEALNIAANTLHEAMRGPGTDETVLFTVLEPLNEHDLKYLAGAFGKKSDSAFGIDFFTADLITWLKSEFSKGSTDYKRLEKIWDKTGLWI